MKIAFIGQKGIPTKQGGIEKHVEELSTRLAKAGFDVSVYSRPHYTKSDRKSYRGVRLINLPSLPTKHLDAISHTLFSSVHALFQNYDVIHYHGVGPSLLSFIPRLFAPRAKVVVTFHCLDREHQKWGAFAKLMLTLGEWTACHFPHETIVVSETLKKYCEYNFKKEVTYIPNGVSRANGKKILDQKILAKYNLKSGEYFLAVSRLIQHKGIHTLIEAYQKIRTQKKLVIVGAGAHTDEYVNQLLDLAEKNKNIIFTGQIDGEPLEAIFRNAYLFVQPSQSEGLSIALLEAMSYGVPVIASDIKENLEVVGQAGLKFRNKNAFDLANKLNYAEKNPKEIKYLAFTAKQAVAEKYDWNDIVKKTGRLYKNLASERKLAIA